MDARLTYARIHLAETNRKVLSIALDGGLCNLPMDQRSFDVSLGTTPATYRRRGPTSLNTLQCLYVGSGAFVHSGGWRVAYSSGPEDAPRRRQGDLLREAPTRSPITPNPGAYGRSPKLCALGSGSLGQTSNFVTIPDVRDIPEQNTFRWLRAAHWWSIVMRHTSTPPGCKSQFDQSVGRSARPRSVSCRPSQLSEQDVVFMG